MVWTNLRQGGLVLFSLGTILRFKSLLRGHIVDPSLHSLVSTMMRLPRLPEKAVSAWLQRDEFWKAWDTIASCSSFIVMSINYEKLDLISVFRFHFIDNSVPLWLKLDAIKTPFHEEVDDDEHIVTKRVDLFLEVMCIKCHGAVGFLPIVFFHFCAFLLSKRWCKWMQNKT